MSRLPEVAAAALALFVAAATAQPAYPGIGRAATPAEVKAWDIDVRPDFQGLPPGAGSVQKGQQVWEGKCASCHGVFGESNQVFNPLVGGTTADDIKTGRVASLKRPDYPGRTTLMKVATVSTLWDYINRAMPWDKPKSLSVEEVYAVTAYLLNLGDILPADFTLTHENIAQVQQRMPNRNGMTAAHALWPGGDFAKAVRPDVLAPRCMKDCPADGNVTSTLPDFARNAHGNLAEQNRIVGAQRGADTAPGARVAAAAPKPAPFAVPGTVGAILQKNNCVACHAASGRVVGPSWSEIASRHAGKADYLAAKIRAGGAGTWGSIPMPPQPIEDVPLREVAQWLAGTAKP